MCGTDNVQLFFCGPDDQSNIDYDNNSNHFLALLLVEDLIDRE